VKGKTMTQRITICSGCRAADGQPGGEAMAARLQARLGDLASVGTTDCMIVCGQPVTVSIREDGKAAYLFSGVDPEAQFDELATFARLYAEAPDGIIDDVRPCGDLRFRLIGRIPA
jgi:predicted metal-binding protein